MSVYKLNNKEYIKNLIDGFSTVINQGYYTTKIPYKAWKSIKDILADEKRQLQIIYYSNLQQIQISETRNGEAYNTLYETIYIDKGFGEYVYNKHFIYVTSSSLIGVSNDNSSICLNYNSTNDCNAWTTTSTYIPEGNVTSRSIWAELSTTTNNNKNKGDKEMNLFKNIEFGPVNDNVRMSIYGIAIKNINNEWVAYDKAKNEIINVDIFNFEASKFVYKMPVAVKEIAAGDIVMHAGKPMFIIKVENGKLTAVDTRVGEEKVIIPTKNMFGFDFVTKVVSFMEMFTSAPTPEQPFGNMLPFMLMGENNEIDPTMMLLFTMNKDNSTNMFSNPLFLAMMMNKDGNKDNLLPFLMMSQMGNK